MSAQHNTGFRISQETTAMLQQIAYHLELRSTRGPVAGIGSASQLLDAIARAGKEWGAEYVAVHLSKIIRQEKDE